VRGSVVKKGERWYVALAIGIAFVASSCSSSGIAPATVGHVTGTITTGVRPGTMPPGSTDAYLSCAVATCKGRIEVRNSEDKEVAVVPPGNYSLDLAPGEYTLVFTDGTFAKPRSETFSVKVGETTHFDTTLVLVYP
jgi:hypothetical protein